MQTSNNNIKKNKLFSKDEKDEFTYSVKVWIKAKNYYPLKGNSGIELLPIKFLSGRYIENLLYRDNKGNLLGFIQYEPVHIMEEIRPNVNLRVHPKHWGEGIATKLLDAGFDIWPINLDVQHYSVFGFRFINAYEKNHKTLRVPRQWKQV